MLEEKFQSVYITDFRSKKLISALGNVTVNETDNEDYMNEQNAVSCSAIEQVEVIEILQVAIPRNLEELLAVMNVSTSFDADPSRIQVSTEVLQNLFDSN